MDKDKSLPAPLKTGIRCECILLATLVDRNGIAIRALSVSVMTNMIGGFSLTL